MSQNIVVVVVCRESIGRTIFIKGKLVSGACVGHWKAMIMGLGQCHLLTQLNKLLAEGFQP